MEELLLKVPPTLLGEKRLCVLDLDGGLGLALLLLDTCCSSEGVRQLLSRMMSPSSSSSLSPLLW